MITPERAAVAKGLLARGEKQHDIAAYFRVNGGRIAELATGKKHAAVKPAPAQRLPSHEALRSGEAVHAARQALLRARRGIDAALALLGAHDAGIDLR